MLILIKTSLYFSVTVSEKEPQSPKSVKIDSERRSKYILTPGYYYSTYAII